MNRRAKGEIAMLRQKIFTADILILVAIAIFGSYPLFLRFYPEISPLAFLFSFQVVGALAFFVLGIASGLPRLYRRDWLLLGALASVALANDLLYFTAFRMTSVANAAVAHQSVSIFLLLFAPLFLKERTKRDEWISLALSLVGFLILYREGLGIDAVRDFVGITLGVLSGLFYSLLIILYRVLPDPARGINIRIINLWRFALSTVILLPFVSLMGISTIGSGNIIPVISFGFLFAVVASGIHNLGLSRARSLHASILGKSEPVFMVIYAFFFLGESPAPGTIIGGAIIVGSAIWLAFRKGD